MSLGFFSAVGGIEFLNFLFLFYSAIFTCQGSDFPRGIFHILLTARE